MTRTALLSLSTLLLNLACEETTQDNHSRTQAATTDDVSDESPLTEDLVGAQHELDQMLESPTQELVCSTEAWQGDHAASEVLRFHFKRWASGEVTIDLEDGFAHPEIAEAMGLETLRRRYDDAEIMWDETFLDAYLGDNGVWLYPHWSGVEGLWDGYIYDTEFSGGNVLNCGGFALHCWDPEIEAPFEYDSDMGLCTNANGEVGMNPWSLPMVRETGDGECADLRWRELSEGEYSYAELSGWNLQGADLDQAQLFFSSLVDAQLEGTNMETLSYGYADIIGSIDDFTSLPTEGCDFESDSLNCHF